MSVKGPIAEEQESLAKQNQEKKNGSVWGGTVACVDNEVSWRGEIGQVIITLLNFVSFPPLPEYHGK